MGGTPGEPGRPPENFIFRLLRETGLSPDLFQAILYKWVCECLSTDELRLLYTIDLVLSLVWVLRGRTGFIMMDVTALLERSLRLRGTLPLLLSPLVL